jgi:predicted nucleotidyltransferase
MSSTPDAKAIDKWLLGALCRPEITGVWLYGSYVRGSAAIGDVDILVRYQYGWSYGAAKLRRQLEVLFAGRFSVRLHMIFLSDEEFIAEADFVKVLLNESRGLSLNCDQDRTPCRGESDA